MSTDYTRQLFHSISTMDLNGVKEALANGADVNAAGADGKTPLLNAVEMNGYTRSDGILDEVLKHPELDIAYQTEGTKRSAGHYAILAGDPVALDKLKKAGLPTYLKDSEGNDLYSLYMTKKPQFNEYAREGFAEFFGVPKGETTTTFYHGAATIFDKFDSNRIKNTVEGWGQYAGTKNDAYEYAGLDTGNTTIDSGKEAKAVYSFEINDSDLANNFLNSSKPIGAEMFGRIKGQAQKENNEHYLKVTTMLNPNTKGTAFVPNNREEAAMLVRAGIKGSINNDYTAFFQPEALDIKLHDAYVREGVEIPNTLLKETSDIRIQSQDSEGKTVNKKLDVQAVLDKATNTFSQLADSTQKALKRHVEPAINTLSTAILGKVSGGHE